MASGARIRALNHVPVPLGEGKTRPQVFECSDGQYWVLKLKGLPQVALWELAADWIGSSLARLAMVPSVECALVEVGFVAITTLPDELAKRAHAGSAYGSSYLAQARPVTGAVSIDKYLSPLARMRIVATDTWLDVPDRQKPQRGGWNLLVDAATTPPRLVAIDYGLAMADALDPHPLAPQAMRVQAPPEWRQHLHEDVAQAVADIQGVSANDIAAVVDAVPEDWRQGVPRLSTVSAN